MKESLFGIVHIKSTFNNIIINITDIDGKVIAWASAGSVGFKGSRRSTPYAAQITAEHIGRKLFKLGIKFLDVEVYGLGAGRDVAIRSLKGAGLIIRVLRDVTTVSHNGCRLPKKRRV